MLIDSFSGKYKFLSNFYEIPGGLQVKSVLVPTVEHAFQACKTFDEYDQRRIFGAKTPTSAKKIGNTVSLRPDWEEKKVGIMEYLISLKFPLGDNALSVKLMKTGTAELVEGNDWGDDFWGCVRPPDVQNGPWMGRNWLGIILMDRRKELLAQ